jgi:DNA-binding NarL/FixJ family response regulator
LGRIRVLLVEDFEPWRHFLVSALRKQPELEVIGKVSDGLDALRKSQELKPDLILLDIGLPTLNGIEAARQMRVQHAKSKILFVSENRSLDIAEEALSSGGNGYLVKSDAVSELFPAIEAVLQGKHFVSASLGRQSSRLHVSTSPTIRTLHRRGSGCSLVAMPFYRGAFFFDRKIRITSTTTARTPATTRITVTLSMVPF